MVAESAEKQTQIQPPAQSKPWLFQKGQSGNPGGKPKGSRNKLQGDFFKALSEDFREHGKKAIENARSDDPVGYLKVVASLMPKELTINQPLQEFTDEQLDAAFIAARACLDASSSGSGESGSGEAQPPALLQPLSETT